MKINTIKNIALGLFLASAALVGCKEEIDPAANAVATESPSVTFAATNAPEQVVPVYADGEWVADCEADWVTISPMSGNGAVDVTVSVTDNLASDGTVDAPREALVIFRGKYIERQGELTVYQKGDNYRDAVEMSIADAAKLEDGKFAKIPEAQIVAAASDGIVVKDATSLMFVTYKGEVKVGDKVYIAGEKVTNGGIASIVAGQVDVLSTAEVTYPSPVDLIANLDPSKATEILYVSVEAGLLGRNLQFETSLPVSVTLLDPAVGGVDLDAVNMHNVKLEAYFVGLNGTTVNLVVTKVEDLGLNDDLKAYFFDDFSWMKPFLDEYNTTATPVGDAVGTDNPSAEAPNLRTTGGLAGLLDEFLARGYEDLNQSAKVIYPQQYYWKFGKTDNHGGIKLPAMELEGSELINAELDFDWSPHMTTSGNIDKVSVVVELEGSGFFDNGTKISDPFVHELEKGDLNWHHVKVLLKGVNNTTRIMIRPLEFASATPDQQRWHLDNIKVSDSDIPYKDPVYANLTVSDEIVTFEGTPLAPFELKIKSDKDWTITKGFETDWFSLDVMEGLADEEATVKILCQPSTSITLRKGTITIASADTRKTIYVVQSAAGGELEPLISIIGGNSGNVGFDAGSFKLGVQANVAYQVEADASWVTFEELPETRAIVEASEFVVKYEANAVEQSRTARIRVYNADLNIESVYTLTQAAFETGVYFQDNFDWVSDLAVAAGAGDSMGNDKADTAPNAYTALDGFADALAAQGYEDLLPGTNTIYLQTNYLKFSRESRTNGIKLPAISYGETTDAVLTFDWGVHVGGGGADAVEIVVELEGNGSVNAVPVAHTAGNWEWQTQKYYLSGVDDNTRIIIKPSTYTGEVDATKTYYRWYIDNIKVAKPKEETVAEWLFTADAMASYADNFGTTAGLVDLNPGDGGQFVAANVTGSGKITYVQVDKNGIELEKAEEQPWRITGGSGHPYVRGIWLGDYWLFEGDSNTTYPAGTIFSINYITRTSKTGFKYWRIEYLDGETWKPAMPVTAATVNDLAIEYNLVMANDGSTNIEVSPMVSLTSATKGLKFRMVALANVRSSNEAVIAKINGGTSRIAGAEGTSPVIKVIK